MQPFKIRCSRIGDIMAYPELDKLPTGAITYVEEWLKCQPEFYDRHLEFSSKYTEKGKAVESDAIDLAANVFGWGMVAKNTTRFSNEYMEGEPDVVLAFSVEDIKSPYSHKTFPLFKTELPEKGYDWQLQGYMCLLDKGQAGVVYCLMDAPENIVDEEARRASYKAGFTEVDAELYDQVKLSMTYSDLPIPLRVKRFALQRNEKMILQIEKRVELIRTYINSLDLSKFIKKIAA